MVAVVVGIDDHHGHDQDQQGHGEPLADLAYGALHRFSGEFHPMGHEMFVRLAGDRVMARKFHVKHTPIPAAAQGRSSSSAS
ncbi:hypothetical protein GCM10010524_56410 [Streptomyces mexicanus]